MWESEQTAQERGKKNSGKCRCGEDGERERGRGNNCLRVQALSLLREREVGLYTVFSGSRES